MPRNRFRKRHRGSPDPPSESSDAEALGEFSNRPTTEKAGVDVRIQTRWDYEEKQLVAAERQLTAYQHFIAGCKALVYDTKQLLERCGPAKVCAITNTEFGAIACDNGK